MHKIQKMLESGIVCFDGAFGSQVAAKGLSTECPEMLNLTMPDTVRAIHRAYVAAGAQVIETNTLGASPMRLSARAPSQDAAAVTRRAVELAKEAGAPCVACSMGTTAEFLSPVGALSFVRALQNFSTQAVAAQEAGADCILSETLTDLGEARAIWLAARATGLPLAATFTFQDNGRTLTGSPPEVCALTAQAMGAFMVGVNCVGDSTLAAETVRRMRAVCALPILCQPNAGMPEETAGGLRYPVSPGAFLSGMRATVEAGAAAVGGCCGTTPEHIRQMVEAFSSMPPPAPGGDGIRRIVSARATVPVSGVHALAEEMDALDPDVSDAACVLLDFSDVNPIEAVSLLEEALLLLTQPLLFRARSPETLWALAERYPGIAGLVDAKNIGAKAAADFGAVLL